MQLPIQIVAQDVDLSDAEMEMLREHAGKLETFFDRLVGCRVTVSVPNRRPQGGPASYSVRIDLTVPGSELVIRRQPNDDLLSAVQDAFRVAGRRLQDYVRRLPRTEPPEARATPGRARVARLFPWEGYGFLTTADGRELYFHRNSVLDAAFDRLDEGDEVLFAEEEGDRGPQASAVRVAGTRRRRGAARRPDGEPRA